MASRVSVVKCNSYQRREVFDAVRKSVDLLGGIGSFIRPGSSVLVKPNLLMAKPPESGVVTNPEVVRSVVKLLKEINCRVYLGDGPSVWKKEAEKLKEVYETTGMRQVAEDEGIELVKFEKRRWRGEFPLTTWLDECDYLVSIPKFKTHELTVLTGAIKNLYGLVSGTYKIELHKRYFRIEEFAKILVDIYQEVKPSLTIVDGVVAMEGDGPSSGGTLRDLGLIFAGDDCVAIDSVLAYVMGIQPTDILYIKEAERRNPGSSNISLLDVLGEQLPGITKRPFKLPTSSLRKKLPRPFLAIAKNFLRFYPKVIRRNCIVCGRCVSSCPQKVIHIKNNKVCINLRKCISCFCCQEACPVSAIKVNKSLLARIPGL